LIYETILHLSGTGNGSFICQGTSTRRQQRDLFWSSSQAVTATTSLATQSYLPKGITSELAGFSSPNPLMLNINQESCDESQLLKSFGLTRESNPGLQTTRRTL